MTENKEQKTSVSLQTKLEVTRTLSNKEETESERIYVRPFETNPANISVKAGATVNLGNYESARVDIMLSIPCYVEEIDDIFPKAKEWVDKRLSFEYQELKALADSKK
jgi:hypothetical protein